MEGLLRKIKRYCEFENIIIVNDIKNLYINNDLCKNLSKLYYINLGEKTSYESDKYNEVRAAIRAIDGKCIIISKKINMILINRLLWECDNLTAALYSDGKVLYESEELVTSRDKILWDFQANKTEDNNQAIMSGWINSYNYKQFTDAELREYVNDSKFKLKKYLGKDKTALEVGVGSGMIAQVLAPMCHTYDGCDISKNVLEKLRDYLQRENITNVELYNYGAHELNKIKKQYDVILMSSVTEYFSGYNYMRNVVGTCIDCLKEEGVLFLGDVFDLDKKEEYKQSVQQYGIEHPDCHYKKDFSHELYIPKDFWQDIANSFDEIKTVSVTSKIGKIDNEINKFRYDVLFTIDKKNLVSKKNIKLKKYQFCLNQ